MLGEVAESSASDESLVTNSMMNRDCACWMLNGLPVVNRCNKDGDEMDVKGVGVC